MIRYFRVSWLEASCEICATEAEPRQLSKDWSEYPCLQVKEEEIKRLLDAQGFRCFKLVNGTGITVCGRCAAAVEELATPRLKGGEQ
jgi:hypothetical protein